MSDLEGRCFIKRGRAFVPADFAAEELLSSVEEGREVMFTVRKPRSPKHHRWFFAMLRKVIENTEAWQTEEQLLDALKIAAGHTERRVTIGGDVYDAPRSISFAAMPEGVFNRFRKRCCYILATKVLGCTPEELMAETDDMQRPNPLNLPASPSVVPDKEREKERA